MVTSTKLSEMQRATSFWSRLSRAATSFSRKVSDHDMVVTAAPWPASNRRK